MCGICGKICFDGKPVKEELIKEMCRSFSYRGPDDDGTYISNSVSDNGRQISLGLGHQRLSIIDLSPACQATIIHEV